MDVSEIYIEMCSKTQEIQNNWSHSEANSGDWYFNIPLNKVYVVSDICQKNEDCLYIPRQDQLQEMIAERYDNTSEEYPIYCMLEAMYNYEGGLGNSSEDRSLEQAWLDFVMVEKYKKRWNSETKEWEKV